MIAHLSVFATQTEPQVGKLLDQLIDGARQRKMRPLVVLGQNGDDLLRESRRLMDCDFVFDPGNGTDSLSLLSAAIRFVRGPSFFIPVTKRLPERELAWGLFEAEISHKGQDCHILTEAKDHTQYISELGLVTRLGADLFLNKGHAPVSRTCCLTSEAIPLCTNGDPLIVRI